jgi:hypothetical protein
VHGCGHERSKKRVIKVSLRKRRRRRRRGTGRKGKEKRVIKDVGKKSVKESAKNNMITG